MRASVATLPELGTLVACRAVQIATSKGAGDQEREEMWLKYVIINCRFR